MKPFKPAEGSNDKYTGSNPFIEISYQPRVLTQQYVLPCTGGSEQYRLYGSVNSQPKTFTHYSYIHVSDMQYNKVILDNCNASQTLSTNVPVTVNGGQFIGQPAFNSNRFTITKGVIKDVSGTSSLFTVDMNSEQVVQKDGTTTITTVKLSNPPPPAQLASVVPVQILVV